MTAGTPHSWHAPASHAPSADARRARSRSPQPRPWLAASTLLALPSLLLLDNAVALARGWHSSNDTWKVLIAGSAALIVATLAAMALPRARAWLGARAPQLLALHVAFAIAWTTGEVVIASAVGEQLWFHRMAPGRTWIYRPNPEYMRGIEGPSRVSINSIGVRGPELPPRADAQRILCIGGSTTLCLYLDDAETWPSLVGERLRQAGQPTWVGNLGQNGYGTSDHVRFLAATPLLRDMDVVVFLVGFNDLMRALLDVRLDAGGGVRPVWTRSFVFALLHNAHQARKEERQHRSDDAEAANYPLRRAAWRQAPPIDALPDLAAALDGYRANLRAMVQFVRQSGARPVFVTQPTIWHPELSAEAYDLLWLGWATGERRVPPELSRRGLSLFNDATRAVCRSLDVDCVDLSALDGVEPLYYDDCHFTEEGSRRVADLVAAALRRR